MPDAPRTPDTPRGLPASAALLCAVGRRWPLARGKSFLTRRLRGLFPPAPLRVEIPFAGLPSGLVVDWADLAGHTAALFGEHDGDLYRFLSVAMRAAAKAKPGKPRRFVDVGANLGLFSLRIGLGENVAVDAFEPQPGLGSLLAENVVRNGLSGKVRLHPVALGTSEGTVTFRIPEGNSYIASIDLTGNAPSGSDLTVPLRRLDGELTPEEWVQVAAVKIDVEGFELHVLQGALPLLERHRPPLVFELCSDPGEAEKRGVDPREIQKLLESVGYATFDALDRKLYPARNGVFITTNIVALASEHAALREAYGFDAAFRPKPRPQWPVVESLIK